MLSCADAAAARQSAEIEKTVRKARSEGTDVRAIVVINPGNPTGQCLNIENMKEVGCARS